MDDWKHHCQILGIAEEAGLDEIKKRYRESASILHPDKHQDSTIAKEKFQQLNESYEYLLKNIQYRKKGFTQGFDPYRGAAGQASAARDPAQAAQSSRKKKWTAAIVVLDVLFLGWIVWDLAIKDKIGDQSRKSPAEPPRAFEMYMAVIGPSTEKCAAVQLSEFQYNKYFLASSKPKSPKCGDVRVGDFSIQGENSTVITSQDLASCECEFRKVTRIGAKSKRGG